MLYAVINKYYKVPSSNKTVLRKTYQNSFFAIIYSFSVFYWFFQSYYVLYAVTAQKMKFSIKDIFSKCDQICKKLLICSHLLKKSLMENFFFCAVCLVISAFPSLKSGFTSLSH